MARHIVQVTGQGVTPDPGGGTEAYADADAQIHDNGALQVTMVLNGDVTRRITFAPGQWDVVESWMEGA